MICVACKEAKHWHCRGKGCDCQHRPRPGECEEDGTVPQIELRLGGRAPGLYVDGIRVP